MKIFAICCWLLVAFTLAGCGATEVSTSESLREPRQLFLVQQGRTSSLILQRADNTLTRYAYGDWRWYAQGETGSGRIMPTLFAATDGALGRQQLAGPAQPDALARKLGIDAASLLPLEAEAVKVDALLTRLDSEFAAAPQPPLFNRSARLHFVKHPAPYYWYRNSNHMVATWLTELGLTVQGNPVFGRWRIRETDK